MVIKLVCPGCGNGMSVPDAYLGKRGKCPKCGTVITVQPAAPAAPAERPSTPPHTEGGAQQNSRSTVRTIKLVCPECGSGMSAPETYLGKRGKCPKCGAVITIQPAAPSARPSAQIVVDDLPTLIHTEGVPRRISYSNIYVIMNNDQLLAFWKQGEGWQYRTSHGYVPVRSAESLVAEQGEFVLAEGNVKEFDEGHRLVGAQFFKIAGGGLKSLLRGESEIFEKIVGRVPLGLTQKRQFLLFIRDHYFQSFTERAGDVIEYLTNEDFHTTQIGDTQNEDSAGLPQEE